MNIKEIRKAKGITQSQAARDLNLSQNTYNRYENGQREPSNIVLTAMADYFRVTVDELLGRPSPEVVQAKEDDEVMKIREQLPKEWYGRTKAHKALLAEKKPLPVWREFTVTPYDLRHSFCCMLRDMNPPIELHTCIRWMGHADASMILRIYDEASDQRSEKEAERLKKCLIRSQNGSQAENENAVSIEK